jgi:hypothetical protein
MYQNKFMQLVQVIKNKVKRAKDKFKDLETLVNSNAASSVQKQEYVELKAKIEAYEDVIDLAEGMIEETK